MKYRVVHTTRYRYSQPVTLCHNEAHLRPRSFNRQLCTDSRLAVEPSAALVHERTDFFGNSVTYFAVQEAHELLTVTATSHVELRSVAAQADLEASRPWDLIAAHLPQDTRPAAIEARQLVLGSPMVATGADLAAFAQPSFNPGRPLLAAVHDLNQRIHREFTFDPESHHHLDAGGRGARPAARGLPGFRPPGDRLRPRLRAAGALHQRLPRDRAAAGQGASPGRRRLARLVRGLRSRRRVGRLRSDQRSDVNDHTSPPPGAATTPTSRR